VHCKLGKIASFLHISCFCHNSIIIFCGNNINAADNDIFNVQYVEFELLLEIYTNIAIVGEFMGQSSEFRLTQLNASLGKS
jgi:hypothetical protein